MTKSGKDQLLKEIDGLSEERLVALADFAAFLREREEWEATLEVLGNPELSQAIRDSKDAWTKGKLSGFVPLSELRHSLSLERV